METVKVYVRKGDYEHERRLSFHWPQKFPWRTLFDHGMAIDGNQAVIAITGTPEVLLPAALRAAEEDLIAFLATLGCEVEFA